MNARRAHEVADVIRLFRQEYVARYAPCETVRKVFGSLESCRTSRLGGHVDQCPECGHIQVSYNSCRNRHCPKCQGMERERWIAMRKEELLPVKYFHVVFTLPDAVNSLLLGNKSLGYGCLFRAAWQTLDTFAHYCGIKTGMTAVLHTWGSNLHFHPHLHCIVPAGGIEGTGKWKHVANAFNKSPFLFPVKGMSKVFRAKFVSMLTDRIPIQQSLRKSLFETPWVVYSKHPFNAVGKVMEYLGRYSHRVAICNSRIKNIENGSVTFEYKDYRHAGKKKLMSLTGIEFLRRFSQHVLPDGFVRIRHYGILATSNREVLRKAQKDMKVEPVPKVRLKKKWLEICEQKGLEYNLCPCCQKGIMMTVDTLEPIRPPPAGERRDSRDSREW